VVADAGVGKTRLAAELLRSSDATVVRGRCLPYGDGITYFPVVEVLQRLDVLPPDEAAARTIRSLLGETSAVTPGQEIAWAFRKTLEHAAAERPLVVVFDDVHWGDQTFLDLIEQVALLSSGAPILLLCMARPELLERRAAWPVTLRLEPLSGADVEKLIPASIGGELRLKIAHASGGNPLFIGEMLAMADEAGSEVVVPPTLQSLLAARLDQLESGERSVLERGAIEGEIFHRGSVQALSADEADVSPQLAALVRKELIRPEPAELPGDDGFRFRHLLIRDAAYDALPKATRAELHARFAGWLEEEHGAALVELDEILGHHLERAYRYRTELGLLDDRTADLGDRAAGRLAAAGRRAHARGDARAACILFAAAAALASSSLERAGYALRHGGAAREAGAFATAAEVLGRVHADAIAAGWAGLEAGADVELAMLSSQIDPMESRARLREAGRRALATFERLEDDRGAAVALMLLSRERWLALRCADMEDLLERALAPAERSGDQRLVSAVVQGLAQAAVFGPRPATDAQARCESLIERAGAIGPTAAAAISMMLAVLEASLGNASGARAMGEESTAVMDERAPGPSAAAARQYAGLALLIAGDPEHAEHELSAAGELLQDLGERTVASTVAALRARALVELERWEEAEHAAATALDWADAGDVISQAYARGALARCQAAHGSIDTALDNARRAVELSSTSDALNQRADAFLDLALVLEATDREQARQSASEALILYRAKGNVVSAGRVARLLG